MHISLSLSFLSLISWALLKSVEAYWLNLWEQVILLDLLLLLVITVLLFFLSSVATIIALKSLEAQSFSLYDQVVPLADHLQFAVLEVEYAALSYMLSMPVEY